MQRFYEQVSIAEDAAGFTVTLDGKAIKTPQQNTICLPEPLARHLAAEWEQQDTKIEPQSMPIMRLVATALNRIAPQCDVAIDEFHSFASSDLLYYRAESPPELIARQQEHWDPMLNWAQKRYDVSFEVTQGIMPIVQSVETLARLKNAAGQNIFRLSGLVHTCHITGSAILALALAEGDIDSTQAYELSCLDHIYQLETWGEDAAERQRLDQILLELASLNIYFQALGSLS